MSSIPLIGRDQPRAMLRAEIDRTRSSHGGMVLVTGEPGIGKTALVTEAADEAGAHGAVVLSGTAWDSDGAPGYWPWVQVLRALRRRLSAGEWHEICAAAGDELSYLLGEAETLPGRADMGGESAFRVQDAVTSALVTAAAHRPVVVVLDDLHAADAASITLLEFVARHTWFERLLLIGTYRDTEAGSAAHPLREAIGALLTKATTITLAGLDASDVGNLMAHTAALAPGDDDVVTVHRRTGGNPFFVEQAVRLWQNGSSIEAGAPGIRETLRARLEDLPDAVEWALSGAALLGREFDLPTLAYAVDMGTRELDGLLEQAVTARLVTRVDAEKLSFVHDLIREVLQSVMDSTQARRWHAAIVRGIERSAGRASEGHQAMLADHAYLAVPEIDPDQARARVLAAVEQACGRLAADEVTLHYRRAVDLVPDGERALYAGLMLDFGDVLRCAGKLTEARVAFQEIVGLGRELGDARLFTRAVLGLHDLGLPDPDSDGPGEIALIDEARALLDEHELPANDPLVVQALAAASRVRVHAAPPSEHAQQLSDRALVRARSCGDDATLALGLLARHDAIWEPGTAAERVALAEEMSGVGRRSGDTELEMQGSLLRLVGLLERGDPNAVEEHSALTALTEHARSPRFGYHARSREATLATLQGRFAEAREAIDSAFSLGEELHEVDRFRLWMEQRWALALQEGDAQEADRLIGKYRDAGSDFWLPEIITAAEHGNAAPARRRLTELRGLHEHYPGPFLPVVLRAQTQAAIVTGDAQLRAQARASLTPLRHLWMVVAGGGTVYGPYAFWLARLDAAERRWDDAVAGFTDARASADVLGAPPWSIAARLHLAEALLARKAPGDAATAGDRKSVV